MHPSNFPGGVGIEEGLTPLQTWLTFTLMVLSLVGLVAYLLWKLPRGRDGK